MQQDAAKALIVEDSETFRIFLKGCLLALLPGMEVLEAEGVGEGYRLAVEHRPRLAVLDIQLPDGNGLDLASRLHAELPATGVVICSSHDLPEYRQAAQERGAKAFLAKNRLCAEDAWDSVRELLGVRTTH